MEQRAFFPDIIHEEVNNTMRNLKSFMFLSAILLSCIVVYFSAGRISADDNQIVIIGLEGPAEYKSKVDNLEITLPETCTAGMRGKQRIWTVYIIDISSPEKTILRNEIGAVLAAKNTTVYGKNSPCAIGKGKDKELSRMSYDDFDATVDIETIKATGVEVTEGCEAYWYFAFDLTGNGGSPYMIVFQQVPEGASGPAVNAEAAEEAQGAEVTIPFSIENNTDMPV